LLDKERYGVLATLSVRRDGWPFASVAAYALTEAGEPLLLLSDLAEHTRNLRADPRASLLVKDSAASADPQAGARVTLLGSVEPTTDASDLERYLARQHQAREYTAMADFKLYVLRLNEARVVSGFGDMGWLHGDSLHAALSPTASQSSA
jgi:putative heme iron utilization protein